MTALQDQIRSDAKAVLARDLAVDGTYVNSVGGATGTVKVIVMGGESGPAPMERGPGVTKPFLQTPLSVQVPALEAGEAETAPSSGIGVLGGVVRLKSNDTLTVPGHKVNRPDQATVVLRVGAGVRLVENAYWSAEVSL